MKVTVTKPEPKPIGIGGLTPGVFCQEPETGRILIVLSHDVENNETASVCIYSPDKGERREHLNCPRSLPVLILNVEEIKFSLCIEGGDFAD